MTYAVVIRKRDELGDCRINLAPGASRKLAVAQRVARVTSRSHPGKVVQVIDARTGEVVE